MSHKTAVTKQILIGLLFIGALGLALWYVLPEPQNPNRVTYTLTWAALFSLPLFIGIISTLFARFDSEDFIKGYAATNQPDFSRAYLSNTVEQTTINVLTAITLGMVVPISLVKLVPIQAGIFVVGRLLYFVTYRNNPMHRFVGFAMGYYVALLSAVASIYWAL